MMLTLLVLLLIMLQICLVLVFGQSFAKSADFEYALAFTGVENLTIKAIFADYGNDSR